MSKHTPGPWLVGKWSPHTGKVGPTDIYVAEEDDDSAVVGEICSFRDIDCDAAEVDANARLIAAAPELLAACWETIQYLETKADAESNTLWGKVSAAYRKASLGED